MGKARWMTGSLVGLALMAGSVTAADARPRYGHGGWGHHHRDRGNGFGFGDAVGVAALIGAAAIVASSLSKDRKAARADSAPPPADDTDYGADRGRYDGPARDEDFSDVATRRDKDFSGVATSRDEDFADDDFSDVAATRDEEDRMTDACALAARDEAAAGGGYAEIRRIDAPRATTHGGQDIDGEVEVRPTVRASDGTVRRFTCSMRDGRVAEVYLSRDVAMR